MTFGQCDACNKLRVLHNTVAYGIDTSACAECLGHELETDIDSYVDLAERYIKIWLEQTDSRSAGRSL